MLLFKASQFSILFEKLKESGYTIIAPTIKDDAIIYDQVANIDELPIGVTDEQDKGMYRLKKRDDNAYFGYALGPYSWKKFLDPPLQKLFSVKREDMSIQDETPKAPRYAFLGVRACELFAISIQDRIFINDTNINNYYQQARENTLIIGVHCHSAAATCFCPSMDTGPDFKQDYDFLLTEVLEDSNHYFILQWGSDRAQEIANTLPFENAPNDSNVKINNQLTQTKNKIKRQLDAPKARQLLKSKLDSPLWKKVATDCTSCANCTMVCPTCFCSTVEDVIDLEGNHAQRWKKWDSCFNLDFSYINGGAVRETIDSRYRQWLTHKLSTWYDQFDTTGCVGCGRCISWCPVGIDFTERIKTFNTGEDENEEH
ncbi:4Fe-4S dicluster domain-containing protein [Halobacteriovorax sp. GFR7]|uniref:4Fe-4S dicluster domain-containing protein n=1 Tax=unclassified Halobacteriovorax TaxID=2639665 RepID=UPI003D996936